jgi:hypothetical protein
MGFCKRWQWSCSVSAETSMPACASLTPAIHSPATMSVPPLAYRSQPGEWAPLREKFERYALRSMRAPIATGALKMVVLHKPVTFGLPFGHMGMDGWSLTWYFPWARSANVPASIWRTVSAPLFPVQVALSPCVTDQV